MIIVTLRCKLEPNLMRTAGSLENIRMLEDWRQGEMVTEDEMVGWHQWFNGQEHGQTPEDGEGQGRAWSAAVHGVSKRGIKLDDWTTAEPNHEVQVLSVQFSHSVVSDCDPMDCSVTGLPVHCQLPEFTQTHVHWVGDAIQPSHPLSSPSPSALNLSQHQGLFKWVSSLNQVAKGLEFQLQDLSFQWTPRTDLL